MMYRLLQRFVQGRSLCVVLACALALSSVGVCLTIPLQTAYAASGALTVGHKIEYASWSTNAFDVNGFEAYCGDPSSGTPESGSYDMKLLTNASVAAGLWYGFGGPGFDAALWPQDCPLGSGDDAQRVMTHVALAYLATGDTAFAYGKCDQSFKDWCDGALFGSGSICERIRNSGFTLNGASESATSLPQGFTAYAMNTGTDTQTVYAMDYRPRGSFVLQKGSSQPELSDDNACYSLAGARYGIFTDAACTHSAGSVTTDATGSGRSPDLEPGTYYIKELEAPAGYALNPTVTTVHVGAGTTESVRVADEPQSEPVDIVLQKVDAETGEARPLGGATLGGAEYTVRFYAGSFATAEEAASSTTLRRTWVLRTNAAGELHLDDEAKVSGDGFYTDAQGRIVLPLGTITLEETTPPSGYLRTEGVLIAHITATGTAASVSTFRAPTQTEQVIRGDLSFVKARETDQHRLAGVPFRLTSNTTGESHVIVTDENGEVRTTSAWNPHTERTNANDAAVSEDGTVDEALLDAGAGVWFGGGEPRDDRGALPFDTYSLSELRVSANAGLELIAIPALIIKREGYEVDWGTLDDQPTAVASLRTRASDALDADKAVEAEQGACVIDEVHYEGVTPGKEYRIAGHLVERASEAVVVDESGTPVSSETTFLAEAEQGTIDLAFSFDAREHAGSELVVLEELTDIETGETIAAESNLNESEQTVRIVATATAVPSAKEPDGEQPRPQAIGAATRTEPAASSVLIKTGDAVFPMACGCLAAALMSGFALLRLRRTQRRRRLRASLRTRA